MATTTSLPTRTTVLLPRCQRCRHGAREVTLHRGLLLCGICRLIAVTRARA